MRHGRQQQNHGRGYGGERDELRKLLTGEWPPALPPDSADFRERAGRVIARAARHKPDSPTGPRHVRGRFR